MDQVNSTTFIKRPSSSSKYEETLFMARDILLNRIFLGNYVERRHVHQINGYRDVVAISTAETELISDLERIRHNLDKNCFAKWVGITGPEFENTPNGYCLWVRLTDVPFGRFWFQIKQIKWEDNEIIFKLKCIRPVREEDFNAVNEEKIKSAETVKVNKNEESAEYEFEFDPAQKLASFYVYFNELVSQAKPHLTWKNLLLASKFMVAMGIVVVSAILTSFHYIGEYFLRLIREIAFLIQMITPVVIKIIDCISRSIAGLYVLIVLLFRDKYAQRLPEIPPPRQHPESSIVSRNIPRSRPLRALPPVNWRERNEALKMQLFS